MPTIVVRFSHHPSRSPVLEMEVDPTTTVGVLRTLVEKRLVSEDFCVMRLVTKWHIELDVNRLKRVVEITDADEGISLSTLGIEDYSTLLLEGPITNDVEGVGQALAALNVNMRLQFSQTNASLARLESQTKASLEALATQQKDQFKSLRNMLQQIAFANGQSLTADNSLPADATPVTQPSADTCNNGSDSLFDQIIAKLAKHNEKKDVEVETRLCIINPKTDARQRIRPSHDYPEIIDAPHNVVVGIHRKSFERLSNVFQAAGYPSVSTVTETIEFNNGRVAWKDEDGNPVMFMKKDKLAAIDIAFPGSPFDLRIGVATKTQLDISTIPANQKMVRQRTRTSFTVSNTLTVDFTIVVPFVNGKKLRTIYEVEAEMTFSTLKVDARWVAELLKEARRQIEIVSAAR